MRKKFPKSQLDAGAGDYADEGKYEGKYIIIRKHHKKYITPGKKGVCMFQI